MTTRDGDERQAARTTIVGGQPPGNDRPLMQIPVGLERLLGMAAVDEGFCQALVADWRGAAAASGLELLPTEARILEVTSSQQLRQMIAQVPRRLVAEDRRAFLSQATAALLALAGGAAVATSAAGCRTTRRDPLPAGQPPRRPPTSQPTTRPTRPVDAGTAPMLKPAGVRPLPNAGMPAPRPRPVNRGIRPDRPRPPKPEPDSQD